MDWFFQPLEHLMKTVIWKNILSHFQWGDWLTLGFAIAGFFYGLRKGFMRMMAEGLEILLTIYGVFRYYKKIAYFIQTHTSLSGNISQAAGFIILSVLIWGLLMTVDSYLSKKFHTKVAGPVKYLGGALLGTAFILLIWSFVSQVIMMIPQENIRQYYYGGSYTGRRVAVIAPSVYRFLENPVKFINRNRE